MSYVNTLCRMHVNTRKHLEVEARAGPVLLVGVERVLVARCLGCKLGCVLRAKVLRDHLVCTLVNLLILVALQVFNLIQTPTFLHSHGIGVKPVGGGQLSPNLEQAVQTVQDHLKGLGFQGQAQELTHRSKHVVLLNHHTDLHVCASACGIGHGPCSLPLGAELRGVQHLNKGAKQPGLENRLDLLLSARSDIGYRPACLLAQTLLGTAHQVQKHRQHTGIQHNLCLHVLAGHHVTQSAQGRGHHRLGRVHQQFDKPLAHPRLQHSLDLVVCAVTQIAQRPAGISQYLLIVDPDQTRKHGESHTHNVEVGSGFLPTAQV
eukprot:comp20291_c0_seq1/m.25464 comp20291_c0_seq1/g.25464  ORF comp20291_c0_seq1/g.25464 comp20291_c0_seq1/m.25464 type:complete len:319 (+) comp20291_c0_seq1:824-1780(+)